MIMHYLAGTFSAKDKLLNWYVREGCERLVCSMTYEDSYLIR